jgi:glycosyltransferase domain-containing protein
MEPFSIVIPTRNHLPYLVRLLSYYQACNLRAPILIADASDEEHLPGIRDAVESASRHLKIEYRLYPPDVDFLGKLGDLLTFVRTDFAVIGADDDFFTVSGLGAAAEFLKANPEFSIAHGQAAIFEVESGSVHGTRFRTANYIQRNIEHPTAAARLIDYLKCYSTTWYSMQRTRLLSSNLRRISQLRLDATSFTELLPGCLSVLHGNAKKLDRLYMVRQSHAQKRYVAPTVFEWVTGADFAVQYKRFEGCLAEDLTQLDKISESAAIEAVKQAFWYYLATVLRGKWQLRYGRGTASSLLKARMSSLVPRLPDMWQRGVSLLGGEQNRMLLPALLRSTSPYHEDFMPIYQAIGGGPVQ